MRLMKGYWVAQDVRKVDDDNKPTGLEQFQNKLKNALQEAGVNFKTFTVVIDMDYPDSFGDDYIKDHIKRSYGRSGVRIVNVDVKEDKTIYTKTEIKNIVQSVVDGCCGECNDTDHELDPPCKNCKAKTNLFIDALDKAFNIE